MLAPALRRCQQAFFLRICASIGPVLLFTFHCPLSESLATGTVVKLLAPGQGQGNSQDHWPCIALAHRPSSAHHRCFSLFNHSAAVSDACRPAAFARLPLSLCPIVPAVDHMRIWLWLAGTDHRGCFWPLLASSAFNTFIAFHHHSQAVVQQSSPCQSVFLGSGHAIRHLPPPSCSDTIALRHCNWHSLIVLHCRPGHCQARRLPRPIACASPSSPGHRHFRRHFGFPSTSCLAAFQACRADHHSTFALAPAPLSCRQHC